MAYLIYSDYKKQIQSENLQQIISQDETILSAAERAAQAEAISYLRQKYDVSQEFTDTTQWVRNRNYFAKARVYLNAPLYSNTTTYNVNDLTLYNGNIYNCNAVTTGAFNPSKWVLLGVQYALFSAVLPYPEFDYSAVYKIGDIVFWKNNIYTCKIQTPLLSHDVGIQYNRIENLPQRNVAPDDSSEGRQYWGYPTLYNIISNTDIMESVWQQVDNRDQQMVLYFIDLTLYHLHSRIAPRNIPDLRVKRYDDAIAWLKMCAKGEITPNLPVIKPREGNRIRYGGNIKIINSY